MLLVGYDAARDAAGAKKTHPHIQTNIRSTNLHWADKKQGLLLLFLHRLELSVVGRFAPCVIM